MSASNLHSQIMNLSKDTPPRFMRDIIVSHAYQEGHRDARHAAAELGARADATIKELLTALTNLLTASENADETGYVDGEGWLPLEKIQLAAHAAIARATGKETGITTDDHKAEVLKYHPNAFAWKRQGGRFWFVWPDIDHDTANDILGSGETEAEAWAQAAANAARMS